MSDIIHSEPGRKVVQMTRVEAVQLANQLTRILGIGYGAAPEITLFQTGTVVDRLVIQIEATNVSP